MALKFDRIGYWSELKLEIVRKYATAYSRILTAWVNPGLYHVYVDAFAGAGSHVSRTTGAVVAGSPLIALYIDPPFREYHLIDLDPERADHLQAPRRRPTSGACSGRRPATRPACSACRSSGA
jgi:three-Cys-motif partner protein